MYRWPHSKCDAQLDHVDVGGDFEIDLFNALAEDPPRRRTTVDIRPSVLFLEHD